MRPDHGDQTAFLLSSKWTLVTVEHHFFFFSATAAHCPIFISFIIFYIRNWAVFTAVAKRKRAQRSNAQILDQ